MAIRHVVLGFIGLVYLMIAGGCASLGPASVAGGECKVFHDPGFAVRGARLKDAQWIGRTQETGIKVCRWRRPTE